MTPGRRADVSAGRLPGALLQHTRMAALDLTGPNAAYVAQLLADYEDAPASVPDEWRRIFEATRRRIAPRPTGDGAPVAAPLAAVEPARGAGSSAVRRHRVRGRARRARRTCSSAASPRRWRSSRRTACTATSPRGSTRSAPSRWATRRSTRRGSCRR